MPLWPLPQGPAYGVFSSRQSSGTITASVSTHASTPHQPGSWVQLIASTADDVELVCIRTTSHFSAGSASPLLLDLALGAADSEAAVISNVTIGDTGNKNYIPFPLQVPAGSRISARVRGLRTATSIGVAVDCYGGGGLVGGLMPASWTTYGADTGNSCGTIIDIPESLNTWSSWTQIAASTSSDHVWWMVQADLGSITTARAVNTLVQVAAAPSTGAADTVAASGTCLYEYLFQTTTSEAVDQMMWQYPRYSPVPSGTPLYARAQSSSATNTDIYVCIYGGS